MKASKRVVTILLALVMALTLIGLTNPELSERALAVTPQDIENMRQELEDIADKIDELDDKLKSLQNDKEKALEQKEYLDQQIALLSQQIAETDAIIANYDELIQTKQAEIAELQAKEQAQYELFCARVRAMEEQGTVSYFSILFNSSSFSELLDNVMLMGEIMDYDNGVIEKLQATRAQLETAKTELEGEQAEQQALRDEQAAIRANLQLQEDKAAELVAQIQAQTAEYEAARQELKEEDARIEQEIKDAQRQMAAENAGIISESGWYWPVPGYYTLTSGFGWRIHPIYGTRRYHNGTDIGGAGIGGTPIGAAKTGVVTTSKYSSSYGNYVVVSHSGGYQTLYAHMRSRAVSEGDIVTQGQTLGYVGTTGASTGNHLHYEVWYNGVRTDAEQYYSNLEGVFYRKYAAE